MRKPSDSIRAIIKQLETLTQAGILVAGIAKDIEAEDLYAALHVRLKKQLEATQP